MHLESRKLMVSWERLESDDMMCLPFLPLSKITKGTMCPCYIFLHPWAFSNFPLLCLSPKCLLFHHRLYLSNELHTPRPAVLAKAVKFPSLPSSCSTKMLITWGQTYFLLSTHMHMRSQSNGFLTQIKGPILRSEMLVDLVYLCSFSSHQIQIIWHRRFIIF